MKRYIMQTGTVTFAIKGRDILRKNGFKAKIERKNVKESYGCGYVIVFEGDAKKAQELLQKSGVKVLSLYAQ